MLPFWVSEISSYILEFKNASENSITAGSFYLRIPGLLYHVSIVGRVQVVLKTSPQTQHH